MQSLPMRRSLKGQKVWGHSLAESFGQAHMPLRQTAFDNLTFSRSGSCRRSIAEAVFVRPWRTHRAEVSSNTPHSVGAPRQVGLISSRHCAIR